MDYRTFTIGNKISNLCTEEFLMNIAILIIDNDMSVGQEIKRSMMTSYPSFRIDLVDNGVEAYGLCCVGQYDLIFCDYKIPLLNGVKAGKFLKTGEDSLNKETPLVLVSSFIPDIELNDDFDFAALIIEKPINSERNIKKIKLLIGEKLAQPRRENI